MREGQQLLPSPQRPCGAGSREGEHGFETIFVGVAGVFWRHGLVTKPCLRDGINK